MEVGRPERLEQGEAFLAGENRNLEMVAKGEAPPSILDGICRLVEENSSGSLCSTPLLITMATGFGMARLPAFRPAYIGAFGGRAIGPTTSP